MAFTWTMARTTVHGDERTMHGTVTCDNTSGSVNTGLNSINQVLYAPKTMTSGAKFAINALPSGTATAGYLAITGCTSGDVLYVTVFGS
jgi:hypothetical protein